MARATETKPLACGGAKKVMLYSWELARYIAVMGITPKRIEGALLSILFLMVELK